eukprot:29398-Rhodomonas_salina.1
MDRDKPGVTKSQPGTPARPPLPPTWKFPRSDPLPHCCRIPSRLPLRTGIAAPLLVRNLARNR